MPNVFLQLEALLKLPCSTHLSLFQISIQLMDSADNISISWY